MKKTFLALLMLLTVVDVRALNLTSILKNRQAAQLMKEQNFSQAQEKLVEALKDEPLWAILHLNLGVCFEALGLGKKAQASYGLALKLAQTPQERFLAEFNMGEILAKQEKVDEALQHYQAALDLDPNSRETKINIELLTNQSGGGGQGDKDDKDQKNDKDQKGKDKNKGDDKDKKDQQQDPKDSDNDKQDQQKDKKYKPNKPQPQKFKSEKLDQSDVNKILGEIRSQEQKIQREYNKKEIKEAPLGKDW